MNESELRAEVTLGHPVTGEYDQDYSIAAAQLSEPNISVHVESLTGDELFTATDSVEFAALTDAKKSEWISWCGTNRDPWNAANVDFVGYIFPAGGDTIKNLLELRLVMKSRAELLGFFGLKAEDVRKARI